MSDKTRYGDGSIRPVGASSAASTSCTAEQRAKENEELSRASLTFSAGFGSGQGYGVKGHGGAEFARKGKPLVGGEARPKKT